jgi:hypothetical protein
LTATDSTPEDRERDWLRRLRRFGWFVFFWLAGVAAVGAVAYFVRFALSFP